MNTVSQIDLVALSTRLNTLIWELEKRLVQYEAKKDSRAVFTYAYVTITRGIEKALPQANFKDPDWIVILAEHFAAHYLAALDASDSNPQRVPPAWQVVFKTMDDKWTSVVEDLLFAMTAHIVHDLPLSLVEVGMNTPAGSSRIADFHQMNDVLAKNIARIADGVTKRYEPVLRWLDYVERKHTQMFSDFGFRLSRGMAWYNADRLRDPASKDAAMGSISRSVPALIDEVRNPPGWSLRIIFRGLRVVAAWFRRWPKPGASLTKQPPSFLKP